MTGPGGRVRTRPVGIRLATDDAGVSPVVGTVLLIAIMLLTVTALMQWGVPAIQDLQRESQYKSALSAFNVMDGVIDEVLPEAGSSRQARVPLANGALRVQTDNEVFAVGWSLGSADVTFDDLADDDADVTFTTTATVDTCQFTHYYENGTKRSDDTGTLAGSTCTASRTLTETHKLEVKEGATVHGVVWLFHTGRIRYTADNPQGAFNMDYTNGAVTTDASQNVQWVVNDPLILKLSPNGLTVSVIDLNGTGGGAGGDAIVRVQATLDAVYVRADGTTVRKADLYPLGAMDTGWLHFLNTSQRYEFAHTSGDIFARNDPGATFPLTLTHFVVDLEVVEGG